MVDCSLRRLQTTDMWVTAKCADRNAVQVLALSHPLTAGNYRSGAERSEKMEYCTGEVWDGRRRPQVKSWENVEKGRERGNLGEVNKVGRAWLTRCEALLHE